MNKEKIVEIGGKIDSYYYSSDPYLNRKIVAIVIAVGRLAFGKDQGRSQIIEAGIEDPDDQDPEFRDEHVSERPGQRPEGNGIQDDGQSGSGVNQPMRARSRASNALLKQPRMSASPKPRSRPNSEKRNSNVLIHIPLRVSTADGASIF